MGSAVVRSCCPIGAGLADGRSEIDRRGFSEWCCSSCSWCFFFLWFEPSGSSEPSPNEFRSPLARTSSLMAGCAARASAATKSSARRPVACAWGTRPYCGDRMEHRRVISRAQSLCSASLLSSWDSSTLFTTHHRDGPNRCSGPGTRLWWWPPSLSESRRGPFLLYRRSATTWSLATGIGSEFERHFVEAPN